MAGTAIEIGITVEQLEEVSRLVFQTTAGLDLTPAQVHWMPIPDRVTSFVHFAGPWMGAAMVEVSHRQGCQLAGRVMEIAEPNSMNDDVRDTMGELANMVGGNLKCLMPAGVALSMPSVVEGSQYSLQISGTNSHTRIAMDSEIGIIWITLVEMAVKQRR